MRSNRFARPFHQTFATFVILAIFVILIRLLTRGEMQKAWVPAFAGMSGNGSGAGRHPQPFIIEASSTAMSPRLRKKVTRMARPTAASAAATVSTNMA